MTDQQILEHNRTYGEASALVKTEILLHEHPHMRKPGWLLRRKLNRALSLFERVLQLNPENWSAMWLVGKIHQRFGNYAAAFSWFDRAHRLNPSQSDVAREASLCAMELGHNDAVIAIAQSATQTEPANAGLHANLALAYVLAGRINDAQASIERSLATDQNDKISKSIRAIILHFAATGRTPPVTTASLQDYCRKNSIK